MRIQLTLKGAVVAYLGGGMVQKLQEDLESKEGQPVYHDDVDATMKMAVKRLPKIKFDSVALVDEEAFEKEQLTKQAEEYKAIEEYMASDEYIMESEFQAELKAEEDAAVEVKRKEFMDKRKKDKKDKKDKD